MRPLALREVEERVRELATRLAAPAHSLPTFGHSQDGARPHVEIDTAGRLHYVVVERGQELERRTFIDLDELLYCVFSSVTFNLACDFELAHRDSRKDSRRLMFSKQVELLRALSPAWAEREAARHAEILARHPFRDASH